MLKFKDFQKNRSIVLNLFSFVMGMKLCGRSKMTQNRRSNIILEFVVFMIVVVGSSTETMNTVENEVDFKKNENQTPYNAGIKMNLIDTELDENEINFQSVHPTEGNLFETISIEKENITTLNESIETKIENKVLIDKLSIPEFEQSQEKANESKVEKLNKLLDAVPFETTTAASAPGETFSTLNPIKETKSFTENTLASEVTTLQIETQTQSFVIHQETTRHYKADLSIYFENLPAQARQQGGLNKVTEDEVIVHSDPDFESDSSSKSGITPSYDSSSYPDENRAADEDDSTISRNSLNEKTSSESKTESTIDIINDYSTKSAIEDLVEEIEAVTESTGELTNDVTIVANVETHTIMKKPGVDDEPVNNSSILEQSTQIGSTKPVTKLDTVVNMVLNTQKVVLEPSSISISIIENQSLNNETLDDTHFKVKENKTFENSKVLGNTGSVNKINEFVDDGNFVGINIKTPLDNRRNKLEINESAILPELQMLLKNQQANKKENGIFQERKGDLVVHENTELYTVNQIEDPMKAPLQNNQTKIISNSDFFQTNTKLPVIFKDKSSSGQNKQPFSELNSILHSENNLPKDNMESKILEEVQEDQTSKILFATDNNLLNSTNDSLLDLKLHEQAQAVEASTEISNVKKINDLTTALVNNNQILTTTDYARHVDSLQTMRDEYSMMSNKMVYPASVEHALNEIVAEGLGKPLPTRSVGDEPSSSFYSSEDKTTTVLVLCASGGGIFIAFSFAIYLISFQRQHGTLDIEMQEQRCGKDNLDDYDDSETRVSLLNQIPTVDCDEQNSD